MLLDYPPAAHMMTVFGACQDEELLKNAMYYIEVFIRRVSPKEELHMIGPAAASVGKGCLSSGDPSEAQGYLLSHSSQREAGEIYRDKFRIPENIHSIWYELKEKKNGT